MGSQYHPYLYRSSPNHLQRTLRLLLQGHPRPQFRSLQGLKLFYQLVSSQFFICEKTAFIHMYRKYLRIPLCSFIFELLASSSRSGGCHHNIELSSNIQMHKSFHLNRKPGSESYKIVRFHVKEKTNRCKRLCFCRMIITTSSMRKKQNYFLYKTSTTANGAHRGA